LLELGASFALPFSPYFYYTYASVLYEIKNGGNILVQMACMKVSIISKCLWWDLLRDLRV
jgi:hypothetical protein